MYINYISPSRTKTYVDCSFKYFLTYECYICQDCLEYTFASEWMNLFGSVEKKVCLNPSCGSSNVVKLKLPTNWGAVNGSIQHGVLEMYAHARKEGVEDWRLEWQKNLIDGYMGRLEGFEYNPDTISLMLSKNKTEACEGYECNKCELNHCYGVGCDEKILQGRCPYRVVKENIRLLNPIVEKYDKAYKTCLGIEDHFSINFDGVDLVGILDLVLPVDKKTVEVIDYKSGSWCKDYKQLRKDIQARCYSVAAKIKYPDYQNHFLTFDYFQRKPVSVVFSDQEDRETIRRIKDVFYRIKKNNKPIRIPLKRDGGLNWYCQRLCSREICDQVWRVFRKRYGESGL